MPFFFQFTPRREGGCNNYTVLSEGDRNEAYNQSYSACDDDLVLPGWYRFQGAAGNMMADQCVPTYRCGTHLPVWLNESHPTIAEGTVWRKVCLTLGLDCCYWNMPIRVRHCGAFFVYELRSVGVCPVRYCGATGGESGPWYTTTFWVPSTMWDCPFQFPFPQTI